MFYKKLAKKICDNFFITIFLPLFILASIFNIRKKDVLTISEPRPDMIRYYETLKLRLKEEIELDKQLTKQSEQALKEDIRQLPGTDDKQKISNLARILEEIEHMKELELRHL